MKAKLYGRQLIIIDLRNTNQTFSNCGFVLGTDKTEKLTLDELEWTCLQCGSQDIRESII